MHNPRVLIVGLIGPKIVVFIDGTCRNIPQTGQIKWVPIKHALCTRLVGTY